MPTPKRQSAFFRATQEAQTAEKPQTVTQPHSDTVAPLHSDTTEQAKSLTVVPSGSDTVEQSLTPSLLNRETVEPMRSSTVTPSHSEPATPSNKKDHKTSFYLTQEQTDKLDDLAYEHKKRTGQRLNRNDIVRHLINQCSLDSLSNIQP